MSKLTKETWIVLGHVGCSSKAVWSHFSLGIIPRDGFSTSPSDPSDFLRCYWLLKLAPEWRERIEEMGQYRGWKKLAPAWGELEAMLLKAWPKSCASGEYQIEPSADKMYERMKELGL